MGFQFSKRSLERMEGVDPRLKEIAKHAITISKIDFGIPADGGLRTAERQAELFADGKSKADGIHNKSRHQSGMALDVYAYVEGKASWETEHLANPPAEYQTGNTTGPCPWSMPSQDAFVRRFQQSSRNDPSQENRRQAGAKTPEACRISITHCISRTD